MNGQPTLGDAEDRVSEVRLRPPPRTYRCVLARTSNLSIPSVRVTISIRGSIHITLLPIVKCRLDQVIGGGGSAVLSQAVTRRNNPFPHPNSRRASVPRGSRKSLSSFCGRSANTCDVVPNGTLGYFGVSLLYVCRFDEFARFKNFSALNF